MAYETIEIERRGPVAWICLNRPEVLNAIDLRMAYEVDAALRDLEKDDGARVVVMTGRGRAFCAGADMGAAGDPLAEPTGQPDFIDATESVDQVLTDFPKLVIAAVNGIAAGGGFEWALTCDIILAAKSAKIGDAHLNYGLLPGGGSSVRLARIVGLNRARFMIYSGDFFSADELCDFGLVTKVVADDDLADEAQTLAERLAERSPLAIRRAKRQIADAYDMPTAQALASEKMMLKQHLRSHDAIEGKRAFAEKRAPDFKGY